jgi:hypothetical protein
MSTKYHKLMPIIRVRVSDRVRVRVRVRVSIRHRVRVRVRLKGYLRIANPNHNPLTPTLYPHLIF